jgi:hypothetical protein
MELMHWHKIDEEPSDYLPMPSCCAQAAIKAVEFKAKEALEAQDDAVHAERRRVVLETLERVERYWVAASSVLPADDATILASKVVAACVEHIRKAGCICPMLDVSTYNEPGRTMPGFDPRCGVHAKSGE